MRIKIKILQKLSDSSQLQAAIATAALLLVSLLFHFPRLFFIADESSRATHQESLLTNLPGLCKWDCTNYQYFINHTDLAKSPELAAFFPAFPVTLSLAHALMPSLSINTLSVVVSNLFSLLAIAMMILLGSALWSVLPEKAWVSSYGRPALLLGLALAVYPHSQFFSYGYSESLFCVFYAATLFFIFWDRWDFAAIFCSLGAVTRPQGLWVLGAFLLFSGMRIVEQYRTDKKPSVKDLALPFLVVIPFMVFLFWENATYGSPFAFLHAQGKWGRHFDFFAGLSNHIPKFDQCRIISYMALVAAGSFFRKVGAQWKFLALTTFMMSEIPLFIGGSYSYPRFSALNLGLFIFIVELARERFWLIITLILLALTRLDVEVYLWVTSQFFIF